ncbi:MAG: HDOD domain-containing protein [Actinomycetia bacterium]|nr:HDOD domain-containing protein [Actinomycetes bacterium]MCP4959063.1 HDOD domain-containing protein [Actinomycetes bacterium]
MTLISTHLELTDLIEELPPLSDTVARLVALTSDPTASADDIANLLMRDGVLTGELLSEANSSALASATPARSVSDAIVRLGLIRVVAVAVRLDSQKLTKEMGAGAVDRGKIMKHQMYAVEAAVILGRHLGKCDRNSLVTTAVLHDIGKLVLAQIRDFESLPDQILEAAGDAAAELELELLQVHHGEVGRVVCDHWSIPEDIGEAIQHHHMPLEHGTLAHATYLVDLLSRLADDEEPGNPDLFKYVPECLEYLGLSTSDFDAALEATRRAISRY